MRLRLVTTHYVVVWSTAASGMTKDSASYAHRIPPTLRPRRPIGGAAHAHAMRPSVRRERGSVTSWGNGIGQGSSLSALMLWGAPSRDPNAPGMHPIPMGIVGIDGVDVT